MGVLPLHSHSFHRNSGRKHSQSSKNQPIKAPTSRAICRACAKTEVGWELIAAFLLWRQCSSDFAMGRSEVIASITSFGVACIPTSIFFTTEGKVASSVAPRAKGIERNKSASASQSCKSATIGHRYQRIPAVLEASNQKASHNMGFVYHKSLPLSSESLQSWKGTSSLENLLLPWIWKAS